ncbi:exonuclease SbcCD subunit D [Pelosinus sp. sgz500959]|uniref:exonuclease SbcCD subunit D n=1 Tax=Pelosinus sp. sgz500959 TaxID=3242472 RepID=UPI00366CBF7B
MRILHTADWHLGKTLEGRDRLPEQVQFIEEICEICKQEKVDLVLIAGDVFQSSNPSAAAEELFYDAIDRLSNHGTRGVVVIAGNHDNPERLCAPSPLAERLGITLIGLPKDEIRISSRGNGKRVQRIACGQSWLELVIPGCEDSAIIAALPYPSEGRLKQLITQNLLEVDMQKGYNQCIADTMARLSANYRRDTVNLAMSHIFVKGGIESGADSENKIQQVGGAYAVDPLVFPSGAQYVALGHLHRPQKIDGCIAPGRYAGSPLAYSFSEVGYRKSVTLVEALPGQEAQVREIYLSSGRPLVKWSAKEGIAQVCHWVESGLDRDAWIDVEVHITKPLTMDEIQKLRSLYTRFIHIRPVISQNGKESVLTIEEIRNLPIDKMFIRFFERYNSGLKPDDALVKLFLDLTQSADKEESVKDLEGEIA